MKIFWNANSAFEFYYDAISNFGEDFNAESSSPTKAIFNELFEITNPLDNIITSDFRKWSKKYADREWEWYLSGNPNAMEIAKKAPIWYKHMDENGNVRSNYGWQWRRNDQIERVCQKLMSNKETRQAVLTFYDAKEISSYTLDTPCTLSVNFYVKDDKLQMTVNMRSNDLWFGFCNDQYCFSKLQQYVANRIGIDVGSYFHFVTNLHIYNDKLNKR